MLFRMLSTNLCLPLIMMSALFGAPAIASDPLAPSEKTTAYLAKQKKMLIEAGASEGCRVLAQSDEILVCGRGLNQRIVTLEPVEVGASKQIKLVAPANGSFGVGIAITGCFLQQCPRKVPLIDVSAFPEAPPGSDADLIARGEMRDR